MKDLVEDEAQPESKEDEARTPADEPIKVADGARGDDVDDDKNKEEGDSAKSMKTIFILSDETGVTAKSAVQNLLDYQFNEVTADFVHVDEKSSKSEANTGSLGSSSSSRNLSIGSNDSLEGGVDGEGGEEEEEEEEPEEGGEYRCEMARLDVYPFVRTEEDAVPVLRKAQQLRGMVVFTFSDPVLRYSYSDICRVVCL